MSTAAVTALAEPLPTQLMKEQRIGVPSLNLSLSPLQPMFAVWVLLLTLCGGSPGWPFVACAPQPPPERRSVSSQLFETATFDVRLSEEGAVRVQDRRTQRIAWASEALPFLRLSRADFEARFEPSSYPLDPPPHPTRPK